MTKIFVYGTLREGESNHHYLQGAKCLFKQTWVYGELYDTNQGFPVMMAHNNEKVIGEVYEVSSIVLASIDKLEGYQFNGTNNLYERMTLDVYNDNGDAIKAITYTSGHTFSMVTSKIEFGDWKVYRNLQKDKLFYYAYGSCMDNQRFKKANVDHFFHHMIGIGILKGHGLRFSHSTADGGKADIVEMEQEHVEGKVYQIPKAAIAYLFRREGVYTNSYRPAVVTVRIDGQEIEVLTFIVIDKHTETPPSTLYKTEILRGGTGFLGRAYLERINSRMNKLYMEGKDHMVFSEKDLNIWKDNYPLLTNIIDLDPVFWMNSNLKDMKYLPSLPVSIHDMEIAEDLWQRFMPFFKEEFPETRQINGIIESPLKNISVMKKKLAEVQGSTLDGELYLKCDNQLPIAGSIKARGGIYEVLQHAETLAIDAGLLDKQMNYKVFSSDPFKKLFSQYTIGVASTGNLGLSIGIMSAKLGFNVSVYMSADAKEWKKALLRSKGATVYEFAGDFSEAIRRGREKTTADPLGYFVDDEDSKHLFLGYSVAAFRLQKQLEEQNIPVDKEHPLFVYLPCGVGGAPGGITFGLKQVFGDHVHCFFVEPTHSPSTLIGMLTGEKENVSVQDFGIDNHTDADGLAVGRPSRFATSISEHLISGIYTMEDDVLYQLLTLLADTENIYVEPSATAGLIGPACVQETNYMKEHGINNAQVTHIAWATGGAMVPPEDMELFYKKG